MNHYFSKIEQKKVVGRYTSHPLASSSFAAMSLKVNRHAGNMIEEKHPTRSELNTPTSKPNSSYSAGESDIERLYQ